MSAAAAGLAIRVAATSDIPALEALYPQAFPHEDLAPLVARLTRARRSAFGLVAVDGDVIGHVAFTRCRVGPDADVYLLGPLCVSPDRQREGVGRALVEAGLARLAACGASIVCVLGDPAIYGRLGFAREPRVSAPWRLPPDWREGWRSQRLQRSRARPAGVLRVPAMWRDPKLWTP